MGPSDRKGPFLCSHTPGLAALQDLRPDLHEQGSAVVQRMVEEDAEGEAAMVGPAADRQGDAVGAGVAALHNPAERPRRDRLELADLERAAKRRGQLFL